MEGIFCERELIGFLEEVLEYYVMIKGCGNGYYIWIIWLFYGLFMVVKY